MKNNFEIGFSSNEVQVPILQKLRFPGAEQRHGVSKFVIRNGVKAKVNEVSTDLQYFCNLITFPLLSVPEPTISHVTQLKIHRDGRHVAYHCNTTWLNQDHELVSTSKYRKNKCEISSKFRSNSSYQFLIWKYLMRHFLVIFENTFDGFLLQMTSKMFPTCEKT